MDHDLKRSRLAVPAVALALAGVAVGATVDALIKAIAPGAGLHHVLAWRYLFGAAIAAGFFIAARRPLPGGDAIRFHIFRSLLQLAAVGLFFFSLLRLGLAEATVIGFTASLMIAPLAALILSEKIETPAMLASIAGFAGAAVAVSDGAAGPEAISDQRLVGIATCLAAAFLFALSMVLLRMRALKEDALTICLFINAIPAIALAPVTLGAFGAADLAYLPAFAMFGALGFSAWLLFTLAYARAPAQRIAPLEYTSLIWASGAGYFFFDETPRMAALGRRRYHYRGLSGRCVPRPF